MLFTGFSLHLPKKETYMMQRAILIAATNSGCGKTTFTAGLLSALRKREFEVQPFKCGPDYIDPLYHLAASGRQSVNLDARLTSRQHLCEVFSHYSRTAEVSVVEGVMGLCDGYDRLHGSTAEIAQWLQLPVVLMVNGKSVGYGVAPLLKGYQLFCKALKIIGVVFNQVGSPRHAELLRQAAADVGITCLGCLPKVADLSVPSRHLGLSTENEAAMKQLAARSGKLIEEHIDIVRLLSLAKMPCLDAALCGENANNGRETSVETADSHAEVSETVTKGTLEIEAETACINISLGLNSAKVTMETQADNARIQSTIGVKIAKRPLESPALPIANKVQSNAPAGNLRIAVARDAAFNFIYRENIDQLRRLGKVIFFSPLRNKRLPSQVDLVYLPGGYPEFFLKELSANTAMLRQIKRYVEHGGRLWAECGGMMLLCRSIVSERGTVYPMADVLHQEATLEGMRLHLGYRQFTVNGVTFRGHEFHYSTVVHSDAAAETTICQYDALGRQVDTPIYRVRNALASYIHLYWGDVDLLQLFD